MARKTLCIFPVGLVILLHQQPCPCEVLALLNLRLELHVVTLLQVIAIAQHTLAAAVYQAAAANGLLSACERV
jgi:hypothetical protein